MLVGMRFKNKGFTIIELLVVIAIIGILASLILTSVQTVRAKGRDAKRIGDMKQITSALNLYYFDNGVYPSNAADVACTPFPNWDCSHLGGSFISTLVAGNYIAQVSVDPLNTDAYHYVYARTTGSLNTCLTPPARGKYILAVTQFEANPGFTNPNFCGSGGSFQWAGGNFES